ncbi:MULTISPECIES: dynamin family protein [unclassified Microcoleus]|uniref:dynamin family protein n=1 Tax=unclassified Microcoleus TaxID=2642155 RepID=UPI002FD716E7
MNSNDRQYQLFQQRRNALAVLVKQQIDVLHSLNMTETEATIRQLEERILTDSFKVLVVGEFNRGKSTFINALLRQEVLPAYSTPTTAIINEVKWGDKQKAMLYYKKPASGSPRSPQEIPVEKIEECVVINNSDRKEAKESPYEKVELFWPLELCRNGVEIIDSPGLNENEVRQQVTVEYLSRVDAVLFILSCEQLGPSISEQKMIELLSNCGHEDIFFICNRFNDIRKKEEQERVRQHGLSQFGNLTKQGTSGIFFITAVDALEGYLEKDVNRIKDSGIELVEQALATFLAKERGRVKIVRSEKVFRMSIEESRKIIPQREAMLRTDLQTLEKRYADAQESLRSLEKERESIVKRISNFREDIKELVRGKARDLLNEVGDKVDVWVSQYTIQESVKLLSKDIFNMESAAKRVVEEVTHSLSGKVEKEFTEWQRQKLQPFLGSRLDDLFHELEDKAGKFFSDLERVRVEVSGTKISQLDVEVEDTKISPINRILSGIAGFVFMDYGSAAIGGLFGYKEMLKSLIPQIATVGVTYLIVGLNPWVLIPAIFASSSLQALIKVNGINDKVKQQVGKEYKATLLASNQSNEVANAVAAKIKEIENGVDGGLGNEIQSVRTQVNSILAEKQKGQANVDQKLRELKLLSDQLNAIDGELNELMRQVAQM